MEKQSFFEDALANFTSEIAYGDAVKRLADEGYSVKQILEKIDYPAPKSRVEKMVVERLCETKIIMLEIPDIKTYLETEISLSATKGKVNKDKVLGQINKKCEQNGLENSYLLLKFDLDSKEAVKLLSFLDNRQKDYISGIFNVYKKIYHRLNFTMREILYSLYGKEGFSAKCIFIKSREIVNI